MDRLPVPGSHSLTVLGRGAEVRGEKWLQLTYNPYENRDVDHAEYAVECFGWLVWKGLMVNFLEQCKKQKFQLGARTIPMKSSRLRIFFVRACPLNFIKWFDTHQTVSVSQSLRHISYAMFEHLDRSPSYLPS